LDNPPALAAPTAESQAQDPTTTAFNFGNLLWAAPALGAAMGAAFFARKRLFNTSTVDELGTGEDVHENELYDGTANTFENPLYSPQGADYLEE
jgi:hypothetical protein